MTCNVRVFTSGMAAAVARKCTWHSNNIILDAFDWIIVLGMVMSNYIHISTFPCLFIKLVDMQKNTFIILHTAYTHEMYTSILDLVFKKKSIMCAIYFFKTIKSKYLISAAML